MYLHVYTCVCECMSVFKSCVPPPSSSGAIYVHYIRSLVSSLDRVGFWVEYGTPSVCSISVFSKKALELMFVIQSVCVFNNLEMKLK